MSQKDSDGFCLVYETVIKQKGDAAIQAPLEVKKRILANELAYQGLCKGKG